MTETSVDFPAPDGPETTNKMPRFPAGFDALPSGSAFTFSLSLGLFDVLHLFPELLNV